MKNKQVAIVFRDCKGGVRTFVEGLLFALNTIIKQEAIEITLIHDTKEYLDHESLNNFHQFFLPRKRKLFWDYISSRRVLDKQSCETIIYLKNFIPLSHFSLKAKKIVVVHDLVAMEHQFREFGWADTLYTRIMSMPSYKMASKVVAVSESTKAEIINHFSVFSYKIIVIPEAADTQFTSMEPDADFFTRYKIQQPYLFYCGSLSPRKNILCLLQAFAEIKDTIEHNLYITGLLSYRDKPVQKYIAEQLADRVFFLGKVPQEDVIRFYSCADLFVYPSLYEGFGLPILEAQQCGCPVLTSDKTSCPEVAGEGAEIIDPKSQESIAQGILNIVRNKQYRNKLIEKGYENAQKYSWSLSAKKLTECIKNL